MPHLLILIFIMLPFSLSTTTIKIIANVNGEPISNLDIDNRIKLAIALSGNQNINQEELAPHVLKRLIDEIIIINESNRLNIKLSDKELNDFIISFFTNNLNLKSEEIDQYVEKHNININDFRNQMKPQLLWNKIIQIRVLPFIGKINNEEIAIFSKQYEKLNSTLTLKQTITEDSKNVLNELKKQEVNCKNFDELARVLKLREVKEFQIKMKDLNHDLQTLLNETSINEIVEEGNNVRLIMLCNIESNSTNTETVIQEIYKRKIMTQSNVLFDNIRNTAVIHYYKD
ncbi:MAG: SurA N-terminal domain-containing protein [Wolbachia endosymbiont of Fragariocoptes setiger]|nr:SurA N-terminal domain-containing protein [Wolbachia endosymbiont of Fragariocoptes setiger]